MKLRIFRCQDWWCSRDGRPWHLVRFHRDFPGYQLHVGTYATHAQVVADAGLLLSRST